MEVDMSFKTLICSLVVSFSFFATPKAVVLDFGGVMTEEPDREKVSNFILESFQLSKKAFVQANIDRKEAIKNGQTDVEFWMNFAEKNGIPISEKWLVEMQTAMREAINPNIEMYGLVWELKEKDVPVILFSNIDRRYANLVHWVGLYDSFPQRILSCDIGVEKPSPEAYKKMLEILELHADEVFFVDDKEENVAAAKALGIDAVRFESLDQIKQELQKRKFLH